MAQCALNRCTTMVQDNQNSANLIKASQIIQFGTWKKGVAGKSTVQFWQQFMGNISLQVLFTLEMWHNLHPPIRPAVNNMTSSISWSSQIESSERSASPFSLSSLLLCYHPIEFLLPFLQQRIDHCIVIHIFIA